jgi:hypothetical protein
MRGVEHVLQFRDNQEFDAYARLRLGPVPMCCGSDVLTCRCHQATTVQSRFLEHDAMLLSPMSEMGVRRGKAALSSGCKSHPANAPAGSNRSSHGGNEMAEAFG